MPRSCLSLCPIDSIGSEEALLRSGLMYSHSNIGRRRVTKNSLANRYSNDDEREIVF